MSSQRFLVFGVIAAFLGGAGSLPWVGGYFWLACLTLPVLAVRGFMRWQAVVAFGVGMGIIFTGGLSFGALALWNEFGYETPFPDAGLLVGLAVFGLALSTLITTIALAVFAFRRRVLGEVSDLRRVLAAAR